MSKKYLLLATIISVLGHGVSSVNAEDPLPPPPTGTTQPPPPDGTTSGTSPPPPDGTSGTTPPPPPDGTTSGTSPPPPDGTSGTTPPPPPDGTTSGTSPPPPDGTSGTPPPPPDGTTSGTSPPPPDGTSGTTPPPPDGTTSGTSPPPPDGTSGTTPPPDGTTSGTSPPPPDGTSGTTPPPPDGTTSGTSPPPPDGTSGTTPPPPSGTTSGTLPPPPDGTSGTTPPPDGAAPAGTLPPPPDGATPPSSSDGRIPTEDLPPPPLDEDQPPPTGTLPPGTTQPPPPTGTTQPPPGGTIPTGTLPPGTTQPPSEEKPSGTPSNGTQPPPLGGGNRPPLPPEFLQPPSEEEVAELPPPPEPPSGEELPPPPKQESGSVVNLPGGSTGTGSTPDGNSVPGGVTPGGTVTTPTGGSGSKVLLPPTPPPLEQLPGTQTRPEELRDQVQTFEVKQQGHQANIAELIQRRPEVPEMRPLPTGEQIEMQKVDEDDEPVYYGSDTPESSNATVITPSAVVGTDSLWQSGMTGKGYSKIGVWDVGATLIDHQELNGRATQVDNPSSASDHSTHVVGTIIAAGIDAVAQGMAFEGEVQAYDWNSNYSELAEAAAQGQLISNHSYGVISGWTRMGSSGSKSQWCWYGNKNVSTVEDYKFGFYTEDAKSFDQIAYSAPYHLIVIAAGNDRNNNPKAGDKIDTDFDYSCDDFSGTYSSKYPQGDGADDGGYDTIMPGSTAKNALTVGAIDGELAMSAFSGWGPTDDGRIKPDVVAPGVDVYSTSSRGTTEYTTKSGTSMASPVVTGNLALVQQYYESLYGQPLRAATLKALAIHTATDLGTAGPDYSFGWGAINPQAAALVIQENHSAGVPLHLYELSLAEGGTESIFLNVPAETSELRVTLAWMDAAGTPPANNLDSSQKMLVNDLDLRVIRLADATVYSPWILEPTQPSFVATTGDNARDNVEQVLIATPESGESVYQIQVSNKGTLTESFQAFSLVVTGNQSVETAEVEVRQNSILVADEGSFNFGSVPEGNTVEKTFTISNLGNTTLNLGSLSLSGDHFTLVKTLSQTELAKGEQATFTISVNGNGHEAVGQVSFTSNDPDESEYNFALIATVESGGIVNDYGDSLANDGFCTLREAITNANRGESVYPDCPVTAEITLNSGTYTLSLAGSDEDANLSGDLDILNNLTIRGQGSGKTVIQAGENRSTGIDRVFDVPGIANIYFTLEGVTLRYGQGDKGGGIHFNSEGGQLSLNEVNVSDNQAQRGGGVYGADGNLSITWSTVAQNSATTDSGNGGGGINCTAECTLSLLNSTVSNNESGQFGGGIITETATIRNSTISGNTALAGGGLIDITSQVGTINLTHVTLYNNRSLVNGYAGGILLYQSNVHLQNSIVAGNTANGSLHNVGNWNGGSGQVVSLGSNLSDTSEWTAGTNDLLGRSEILLSDLTDNGGTTRTHQLQEGSLAIDRADLTACSDFSYDQRGYTRIVNETCDVGAVEYNSQSLSGASTEDSPETWLARLPTRELEIPELPATLSATPCTVRTYHDFSEPVNERNLLSAVNQWVAEQDWEVSQSSRHGGLEWLTEEGRRQSVTVYDIQAPSSQTPFWQGEIGEVIDLGLEIATLVGHATIQSPCILEQGLESLGLSNYTESSEGVITVPANRDDEAWFVGRAAWTALPLSGEVTVGFYGEQSPVYIDFMEGEQGWRQYFYPVPHDATTLQTLEDYHQTLEGIVDFVYEGRTYHGQLDYLVTQGENPSGKLRIEELPEHGESFIIVYPDGQRQKCLSVVE